MSDDDRSTVYGVTTKQEWRAWAGGIERSSLSSGVTRSLAEWAPLRGTVLSYLAMSDEVGLAGVHALSRCRVVVTRTPTSGPLEIHEFLPDRLERHPLGYLQPTQDAPLVDPNDVDVVLVPGLVFDRCGSRLGRGKGYYDGLLERLPSGVARVGVTVDGALVDAIPTEPHDQCVAWVATESAIHRVGEPLPAATERFVAGAIPLGVAPDIHRFPAGTKTSADAAVAVGAELGEIAKSILFMADGHPVLVIASGDRRIDEEKLASVVGARRARIASLETVRDVTGFVAGGTPGIGLPRSVKVVADSDLARYRWVWSAAGTPDTVYPVALDRLIEASGARWADVTDRGNT